MNGKKRNLKINLQIAVLVAFTLFLAMTVWQKLNLWELLLFFIYFVWSFFTLGQLSRSEKENRIELERNSTLIQCVTELSSSTDINQSIDHLLEIINNYFMGDRAYIFDIDYERKTVSNTFEYAAEGVTKEIDNLQNVDLANIKTWIDVFYKKGSFFISNLDQAKDRESPEAYECLKAQNIDSLIAVPLLHGKTVTGFLGVDNPREHYRDFTLLSSIQFFIMNSLATKAQQDQLHYLSYRDALTGLYNRNRYVDQLEESKGKTLENVGVAYLDLNGLKKVNDACGHEAGDCLICAAAAHISRVFPEHGYRIGGDEFVVVCPDIDEQVFRCAIDRLIRETDQEGIGISCGFEWTEACYDMEELMKKADTLMYKRKKAYYEGV